MSWIEQALMRATTMAAAFARRSTTTSSSCGTALGGRASERARETRRARIGAQIDADPPPSIFIAHTSTISIV